MTSADPFSQRRFLFITAVLIVSAFTLPGVTSAQVGESQAKESAQDEINRAQQLLKSRQYEQAADILKQVIARQPDSAVAHSHLAIALVRVGRAKEALAFAQRAIELDPNYAFSYLVLGEANQAMNRFDEAIEAVKRAIQINPEYLDAYGVLGSLYGQTKRYEESGCIQPRASSRIEERRCFQLWCGGDLNQVDEVLPSSAGNVSGFDSHSNLTRG